MISKVTRKKINFQNLLACTIQKLALMKIMAHFPAHHMINVDEKSCSKKRSMVTHGHCASNEELVGLESGKLMAFNTLPLRFLGLADLHGGN